MVNAFVSRMKHLALRNAKTLPNDDCIVHYLLAIHDLLEAEVSVVPKQGNGSKILEEDLVKP